MYNKEGFILLHRRLQDHWLYPKGRKFSELEAWLDLLFMAAYTEHQQRHHGKLVPVQVGEFITSIRELAKEWRWSREKTTGFIKTLIEQEMLTVVGVISHSTTYKITNYEYFQKKIQSNSTTHSTRKSTTHLATNQPDKSPKSNPQAYYGTSIKNGKELKEENNSLLKAEVQSNTRKNYHNVWANHQEWLNPYNCAKSDCEGCKRKFSNS